MRQKIDKKKHQPLRKRIQIGLKKIEVSQNKIARVCGIDKGNFSKYLHGRCCVSPKKLSRIKYILHIDMK